jgi:hypothetical protein
MGSKKGVGETTKGERAPAAFVLSVDVPPYPFFQTGRTTYNHNKSKMRLAWHWALAIWAPNFVKKKKPVGITENKQQEKKTTSTLKIHGRWY